ncbi:unnamed protein product [Strongylus vulgaris]|uniref:RRM domain-containing protein n=1 Tax=Strongylus vulgaris TaxID=40348 RepID=A0A3P7IPQ4_STRVU|nr:unnamed protein product [Strongylus vulgaris]
MCLSILAFCCLAADYFFFRCSIQIAPVKQKPVTTVFVGNISEKCSNEFMQQMLQECGTVTTWKRIQGSNGKFQAFGFCDFEEPEGTLRALRVLNDFQIGEKKLVVKVRRFFSDKELSNPAEGVVKSGSTTIQQLEWF